MRRSLTLSIAIGLLMSIGLLSAPSELTAQRSRNANTASSTGISSEILGGLEFRELGPAVASGRVADIAVHPERHATYYLAIASGGVWKTENAGTTWTPLFDDQSTYSIGCITIDPSNPNIVWVGTGENNSQRSVAYGDGVYKSLDGGKSWENVGLEDSEHIGRIVVDPNDSNTVFVAAQGPLWRSGGDRGLYKTTDGGASWDKVLEISEHTGVNEVWIDPRDSNVLYASAYQRQRRTWTLIDGGPESGIYKSTDGGENWDELSSGLPSEDMGKIGLAVSPVDPDVVYAIVESIDDAGGFFRSRDAGATWKKMGDYVSGSPQYYNEIVPDPHDVDRVYSMDTWLHVTENGGTSFEQVPETSKHVDNHALWIDPGDADHLIAGCDGGVYESFDRGATWDFKANLPITQFYKIAVDNDKPFYNVYGGTQDNSTLGGPTRTTSHHGITNRDWFVTVGGDGFKPQVDPTNADIVYSQWQYGGLVRYDRVSGELTDIKPQPDLGEAPPRWNWDAAFIISPHSPTRLYFASQRIYRSEDRGDSWNTISADLSAQVDRNKLEIMGRVWSVDAVAKNRSTSFYGNIVSLAESPLVENLLYAGTDDGLIRITSDGGDSWSRVSTIPGVPQGSYVADIEASEHYSDVIFAAFDNHKSGDFKPYLMRSADRGQTWSSVSGDLPNKGTVYTVVEDHVEPNLLFAGTEFGVFVTVDGGRKWTQLDSGLPTIAVRDLVVQRRENDLVVGTFGRGIYVLDDYTPLRQLSVASLSEDGILFPPKKAWMFHERRDFGYNGKAFQGDSMYSAENPPVGAVFTYYLKESAQTRQEKRRDNEQELRDANGSISYPSWDELRLEDHELDPTVIVTVVDEGGEVIRRITGPAKKGIHRVHWDLRYPPSDPIRLTPAPTNAFASPPMGPLAAPGTYRITLGLLTDGGVKPLGESQTLVTQPLGLASLAAADAAGAAAFSLKVWRLQRASFGAARALEEAQNRLDHVWQAVIETPCSCPGWIGLTRQTRARFDELGVKLLGDRTVASRSEPTSPSILGRVNQLVGGLWSTSSAPTNTQMRSYAIASEAFGPALEALRSAAEELTALEEEMDLAGAPWTPGRVPQWEPE